MVALSDPRCAPRRSVHLVIGPREGANVQVGAHGKFPAGFLSPYPCNCVHLVYVVHMTLIHLHHAVHALYHVATFALRFVS